MPGRTLRMRVPLTAADARAVARAMRQGLPLAARVAVRAVGLAGRAKSVRHTVRIVA
jgi:hypothetical protein